MGPVAERRRGVDVASIFSMIGTCQCTCNYVGIEMIRDPRKYLLSTSSCVFVIRTRARAVQSPENARPLKASRQSSCHTLAVAALATNTYIHFTDNLNLRRHGEM